MVSKTHIDDKLEDYKGKKLIQSINNSINAIFQFFGLNFLNLMSQNHPIAFT